MTIGSINSNNGMLKQIYSPQRQSQTFVRNNTTCPNFKGSADEVCLSRENSKSKYEVILDNRVKKGLNHEMAKE